MLVTTPFGCGSTVDRVDDGASGSSGSKGSSAASDMCSGAASIEGDGAGCPCGVDMCGFCQACAPCATSADCTSQSGIEKCIHGDHQCGKGAGGECIQFPPSDCTGTGPRVCLCDGGVSTLDCASAFGLDVSDDLAPCLGGTFACGDETCQEYVEYCVEYGGEASGHACEKTPTTCSTGIADCACIDAFGECSIDMEGQVRLLVLAPD